MMLLFVELRELLCSGAIRGHHLEVRIPVHTPVFRRGTVIQKLEHTQKRREAGKSGCERHLNDRETRVEQ